MNDRQETGRAKEETITLERRLVDRLENLAREALSAMEATNASADEPIYTDSSLGAAYATLEELRSVLVRPEAAAVPSKNAMVKEPSSAVSAVAGHL